ncbi:hypothetical protein OF83DRAFT_1165791 [Amylostereum chailletii]|nr:hypothetical protein OF83DRAFT_1165791 [Amylostereum chailletii]
MSVALNYAAMEHPKWRHLPPPPGFSSLTSARASTKPVAAASKSYEALKERRAWEFGYAPAKQLPMQAFMLYMSGGGVQIFSMGIVAMLLFSPFKNLAAMNAAFSQFAPGTPSSSSSANATALTTLLLPKLLYVLCNALTLGLGLWKCRQMGLLPTGTGDWLAFETRGPPPEMTLF